MTDKERGEVLGHILHALVYIPTLWYLPSWGTGPQWFAVGVMFWANVLNACVSTWKLIND